MGFSRVPYSRDIPIKMTFSRIAFCRLAFGIETYSREMVSKLTFGRMTHSTMTDRITTTVNKVRFSTMILCGTF
jgi:hypothetical protein